MPFRTKNHRQNPHSFPRRSNPRATSQIPICDFEASKCLADYDALHIEERRELRDRSFDELKGLQAYIVRIVVHDGMRELLRKIYAVAELTQEELARRLKEDPARICTRLKQYRSEIQKFALQHPEWTAELAPRHQRMIFGCDPRE